jgi:curved DNA-binding protein CbpA
VSSTRVRDWGAVDFYAVLGVEADASDADLAVAYRGLVKQLHPDTNPGPEALARFHDVSDAYRVLSDHRRRRDYDAVRRRPAAEVVPMQRARSAPKPTRWTPRRAWTAVIAGSLCALLGLAAGWLTWHLHEQDANRRAAFVPVVAEKVGDGQIRYLVGGRQIITAAPRQHGEAGGNDPTMNVRYDPADPEHVIVDKGSFGRDITFAIVALKLLIGGAAFAIGGAPRLRRL